MKTAILKCLQEFSSKNSKNVYHDQFFKDLKLQCQCKIVQNFRVSLKKTRFMKTPILKCLQQFSTKNSKNVYHDQFLKKVKITVPLRNCAKRSFHRLNNTFNENCYFAVFAAVFQ